MKRIICHYNWDTTHDTANNVMVTHFVNNIILIVDFRRVLISVTHRGHIVDIFKMPSCYTTTDHSSTQCEISEIANGNFLCRRRRLKRYCNVLRSV